VAVREQPARQVWIGFDSPEWARRPEYVVFWANVFDWLAGSAGPEWRTHPVGPLGAGWRRIDGDDTGAEPGLWPGLYERREDGVRRALNATDVRFPSPGSRPDWRPRLAEALRRADGGRDLAPGLLVAAVACLALAARAWKANRRPAGAVVGGGSDAPPHTSGTAPGAASARSRKPAGMS
jgi:hypothetical protein